MRNKKGSIQDFFFVMVIFVIAIMMIGLMMLVWSKVRVSNIYDTPTAQVVRGGTDRLNNSWDTIFFTFGILIMLTPILAAFLVGAHPAFIWIAVIVGIFVIFFSVIMNNVWDTYIKNGSMAVAAVQLPKVTFLMTNLPIVLTVMLGLLCVAMFFGFRFGAGGR